MSDARRGQGKHRSERSTATNTGKHRALETTSGTSRRGGAVVAFAGLVGTPTAIAAPAALVAGTVAFAAPAVAATEVNVTNLAATLVNPPSGSTIGVTDTVTLEWTFDVPASARAGDTSVFTVPGYLVGAVNGLDVKDDSGAVIGSITGSQQTFTLTYADYVDTHDNVNGKIRLAFSPRETVWGNSTTRDISVTNGTSTALGGQLTLVYSTVSIFSESSTLAQQNSTWQTDLRYYYSSPTFKVTDVGVKQTTTFNIDDDTQSKATFNCDAIKSTIGGRGVRYFYGPDKSHATAYSASSASDPLGMEVVACTPTSVTVTYTVAEAGTGFTLSLASSLTTGDAVSLSDEAIANQYTGPYKVHTVRTPDGGASATTRAQSRYDFSSAGGGGTQSPKASIVAYIADSNAGNPTGQTADGQNSDANDGSPVALEPGQQTVSVVVTNTGAVAATSGKLLDSVTGAEVGQTGPLAAGETKVYQFTVDVPAGTYRNVYTVMLEGTNGGSGPKSDEVNATAVVANPTANNDTATTDYNTPVTVDVLANDEPSGTGRPLDAATLTLLNGSGDAVSSLTVTGGTYAVDNGQITFTPNSGFTGAAPAVDYRVADTAGHTASATVKVSVSSVTPTALNDTADAPFESPVTINVLANDEGGAADVELDPASLTLVNSSGDAVSTLNVTGGKYEVVSGQIKFTPDAGFAGSAAAVTYRVANETGATATATVQVAVASVYPHATNDSATTAYETAVSVDVLANDDSGAPSLTMNASSLTLLNSSGQAVSTLTVNGGTYSVEAGKIKFTPNARFIGTADTVTYRVANSLGKKTSATVKVTVGGVSPFAKPDSATTPSQTSVTVDVLANDGGGAADNPLNPATLTLISSSGAAVSSIAVNGGTYKVVSGKVVFSPSCHFQGTAPAVSYRVADSFGTTVSSTVQVTVTGYPPVANPDSATTRPNTPVSVNVLYNDYPGSYSTPLVSSTLTLLNSSGNPVSSLSVAGGTYQVSNGRILFTPYYGFIGRAETVQYRVADTAGVTATSSVRVTVGYTCWW